LIKKKEKTSRRSEVTYYINLYLSCLWIQLLSFFLILSFFTLLRSYAAICCSNVFSLFLSLFSFPFVNIWKQISIVGIRRVLIRELRDAEAAESAVDQRESAGEWRHEGRGNVTENGVTGNDVTINGVAGNGVTENGVTQSGVCGVWCEIRCCHIFSLFLHFTLYTLSLLLSH